MSDVPQGPDWWRASNGLFYPPEAKPGSASSPDPSASDEAEELAEGEQAGGLFDDPPVEGDDPGLAADPTRVDQPAVGATGWDTGAGRDETVWAGRVDHDGLDDDGTHEDPARRGWLVPLVLVGLLVVALAAAGIWWLVSDQDGDTDTATTTTLADTTDTTDDTTETTVGTTSTTVDESEVSAFDLGVGDCFDVVETEGADGVVVDSATLVECDEPHRAEVYAIESLEAGADDPFPGVEERDAAAMALCEPGFEEFVGIPAAESELALVWLAPTGESWEEGDRTVTCAVSAAPDGEPLTESMAGAER